MFHISEKKKERKKKEKRKEKKKEKRTEKNNEEIPTVRQLHVRTVNHPAFSAN